ncbi:uncharacterized protein LOC112505159 [Cynara cardunculus var. scolymus]|uniref:C2 calcium/lipid-binding domain, CaLB n=1 Tax=Cynara cardunculus var. scolymus TaxID=59895 RepID=A0A103KV54_CYNCS|nr:uncharacterized protein LOC112505159 [Cynara cardunculus var. scolymus]KVF64261.1 C2 calcium/lipid-binding domain, CaLB [Cynara cardunculus var. scolymus]
MDAVKALSSLQFEVKIVSAKNIQVRDSKGYLFVRCYLSAGNNKRVRLESRDISTSGGYFSWNESFSLDCLGTKQSMDMIIQGTVVFELRCRSTVPLIRMIIGGDENIGCWSSQLLGRAEVPWREIFESSKMESERWIVMRSKKIVTKSPSVCVTLKIQVPPVVVMKERNTKDGGKFKNKWDESCGCSHGHCCQNLCVDSEMVAMGLALDAF